MSAVRVPGPGAVEQAAGFYLADETLSYAQKNLGEVEVADHRSDQAYLLYLNDIVKDEDFELSDKNFTSIKMPNATAFYDDDRETSEKQFWKKDPCMKDCRTAPKVTGRAISVDVTPDSKAGPKVD